MGLDIGKRIKTARLAGGLSQRGLAARTDVANATISQIESGRVNPTIAILERLAGGLGISLIDLLAGADTETTGQANGALPLSDAVEHLSAGFALFDSKDRLVLCNSIYRDFYGYTKSDLRPGITIADLLNLDIAREVVSKEAGGVKATENRIKRFHAAQDTFEVPLADGRWVQIRDRRTSDGGTVSIHADITERKRAETMLRENEERFRDFSEAATDWFWEMDENLRFTYFSDRFTEISGVANEDLIGKTRQESGLDLKDDKKGQNIADLEGHRPFKNFEHNRVLPNGDIIYMSTSGKPVFDADGNFKGYRGTGSDITERKRAEKALSDQLKFTEALVDTIPNPILVKDPECRYVTFNRAYEEAFDVKRED